MSGSTERLRCPHCGQRLRAFRVPDEAGWDETRQWACFNDECAYYREGWEWMWNQYRVRASYRYRVVDAKTGHASPIGVWSETALRDRIIDEDG